MEPVHIALLAVFGTGLVLVLAVLFWPRRARKARDDRPSLERDNIHFAGSSHSAGGSAAD